MKKGFTLIELLTVFAIIGILAAISIPSFNRWLKRYHVERDIKELFGDLLKARILAMNKNLSHFVVLEADGYSIYEDSDPSPFGDGSLDPSKDRIFSPKHLLDSNLSWNGGNLVEFNEKGLTDTSKTICILSDLSPSYDCIKVSRTMIRLGKLKEQTCNAENCEAKR